MKLIRFKKYIFLCQCKGCKRLNDTIVAVRDDYNNFYHAYLCSVHAVDAIRWPFIELRRF